MTITGSEHELSTLRHDEATRGIKNSRKKILYISRLLMCVSCNLGSLWPEKRLITSCRVCCGGVSLEKWDNEGWNIMRGLFSAEHRYRRCFMFLHTYLIYVYAESGRNNPSQRDTYKNSSTCVLTLSSALLSIKQFAAALSPQAVCRRSKRSSDLLHEKFSSLVFLRWQKKRGGESSIKYKIWNESQRETQIRRLNILSFEQCEWAPVARWK